MYLVVKITLNIQQLQIDSGKILYVQQQHELQHVTSLGYNLRALA